jgi:hypothetical protein
VSNCVAPVPGHEPDEESSEKGALGSDEEHHGYPSGLLAAWKNEFARHGRQKPDRDPAYYVRRLPGPPHFRPKHGGRHTLVSSGAGVSADEMTSLGGAV